MSARPRRGETGPRVVTAMRAAVQSGRWVQVPDRHAMKVQRSRTLDTPDTIPDDWWPEPTYVEHESIALIAGRTRTDVIHRRHPAPWVQSTESTISAAAAERLLSEGWAP